MRYFKRPRARDVTPYTKNIYWTAEQANALAGKVGSMKITVCRIDQTRHNALLNLAKETARDWETGGMPELWATTPLGQLVLFFPNLTAVYDGRDKDNALIIDEWPPMAVEEGQTLDMHATLV